MKSFIDAYNRRDFDVALEARSGGRVDAGAPALTGIGRVIDSPPMGRRGRQRGEEGRADAQAHAARLGAARRDPEGPSDHADLRVRREARAGLRRAVAPCESCGRKLGHRGRIPAEQYDDYPAPLSLRYRAVPVVLRWPRGPSRDLFHAHRQHLRRVLPDAGGADPRGSCSCARSTASATARPSRPYRVGQLRAE